jgi:O-antigen/teichoic acid export membrane protein
MGWIETQKELPYNRIAPFSSYTSLDSPLADLLNLKYIVTEEEIPLPKYKLVYENHSVRIYENLGNVPRAYTLPASSTLIVPSVELVGKAILDYDPRFYTIIEESSDGWIGPKMKSWLISDTPEPAQFLGQSVISYTPNEVIIDVNIDTPSWLVLSDTFYPGWKAFSRPLGASENEETEIGIARVAGNFRGVQLDNSATIRFKYSPNSVKVGAFISFLSGMTIIFLAVIWLWRLIYRENVASTTAQRLAKNSIAPILLTLFNRVLDFGLAALTLRILGPSNAGELTLAISVFVWFDIITNFGLNTYLTREVSRHRDQTRRYLINTTAIRIGLGIAALPLLGAYIGLRQTVFAGFDGPASSQMISSMLLLYIGLLPNSVSTGLSALFYAYEKAEYPAVTTSISTLLKATLQVIVLVSGLGIIGLAGTSIIVNIITLGVLAFLAWQQIPVLRGRIHLWQDLKTKGSRILRKSMVQESWPLMLNHLLANSFYKVDIPLMDIILGSASLGLYSIGYKLLDALMVIPSMFTLALFPVISQQAQDDKLKFIRFYHLGAKILITIALPAAIITTIMAREMVLILGGQDYIPGAVIVLQLIAWSIPLSWFNGLTQYVLIALDKQRFLSRAYVMGFSFSFLTNLILMRRYGYTISAILHIFAELVLMVLFLIGVRKYLGKTHWLRIVGASVSASAIAGAVGLVLIKFGRGTALAGFLIIYPILLWLLKVLTPEERALLMPGWRG